MMRHAKSSWGDEKLRDIDRPLNTRGQKDASRMGAYLKTLEIRPNQIFSSPAERSRQTAVALAGAADSNEDQITWDEELYYGSAEAYLNAIQSASNASGVVMTIGHNPMTADLMAAFSRDASSVRKVPTASIACFETDAVNWKDVTPQSCKLLWFITPGDL